MDSFDEHIMMVLRDGKPRGFHQLLEEVGFSHNTLRLHLNTLVERGQILREKTPVNGRGRPRFMYFMPQELGRQASSIPFDSSEVVTLTFKELRLL